MKVLYILQGPSGCGKSTFAQKLKDISTTEDVICCADDYHMIDGEYKWSAARQGYAHGACQSKCKALMEVGTAGVIVSNTNTTWKEVKTYVDLAATYGYNIIFGRPRFNLTVEELAARNVHNVPEASLTAMKNRLISVEDLKSKMIEHYPKVSFMVNQFDNK